MWPDFEITDQNIFSPRLARLFWCAAWAEALVVLAVAFVWYCYILTLEGKPSPLRHLAVQILIGAVGAASAVLGTLLSKAMWTFWREYDRSPKTVKTVWYWVMTILIIFGSAAYYHLVYREQLAARQKGPWTSSS